MEVEQLLRLYMSSTGRDVYVGAMMRLDCQSLLDCTVERPWGPQFLFCFELCDTAIAGFSFSTFVADWNRHMYQ